MYTDKHHHILKTKKTTTTEEMVFDPKYRGVRVDNKLVWKAHVEEGHLLQGAAETAPPEKAQNLLV